MLFVFDWDGTLIDSTAKIVKSMQIAADRSRLPILDDKSIKNIIGLGLPEAIGQLYPEVDVQQRQLLQRQYSEVYLEQDNVSCQFFPGVVECLDALQLRGYKIAVATGKSRRGLDRVLKNVGWQSRFDATRCADETASKPDPKMLLEIMSVLSCSNESTWMVGDTEFDLEMASKAQVKSIGVSYGAHDQLRLERHDPVAIVDNLGILLEIIQQ
jgi:phosphoglycolate phosphatase